jgi:RHS repeat-associated protein
MTLRERDDTGVTITYTYGWDDFNKLIAVSSADSGGPTTDAKQESIYGVNGFRRRKKDKADVVTTEYANGLATAVAKSATSTVTYLKAHQLVGFEKDGDFFYFLTDALGSVRDIVDENSDVVQSYEFNEHGLPMPGSGAGSVTSAKTYHGGLSVNDELADTGLYLMGQRFWAPELGRFLSRDPIGFSGGLNLFNGHGVSPITMVDPWGLDPTGPVGKIVIYAPGGMGPVDVGNLEFAVRVNGLDFEIVTQDPGYRGYQNGTDVLEFILSPSVRRNGSDLLLGESKYGRAYVFEGSILEKIKEKRAKGRKRCSVLEIS